MSIHIKNMSHIFHPGTSCEKRVLHNISLTIEAGSCLGITGRSGSGKTTLIQHLNGLLQPTSGSVAVNGATSRAELRRQVGVVCQYPEQQLFGETVYADIAFGLSNNDMSSAERELRVREAMHAVGLGDALLDRSPFSLSGGQKRRVAIAGILVMRPPVFVLDEPAAGLDPQGRRDIFDTISILHRQSGLTVVVASSSLDDMVRLADKVVILKQGSVEMEGTPGELFRDPTVFTANGLSAPPITVFMNRLKRTVPEIEGCQLTVEDARDEIVRVWNTSRGIRTAC